MAQRDRQRVGRVRRSRLLFEAEQSGHHGCHGVLTGRSVPRREPVLAAMNLALQLRFLAPQLTRMDAVIAGILRRPPRPPRTAANGQLIPRGGRPSATRDRYAAPGHA